jgi:hypothetical protein
MLFVGPNSALQDIVDSLHRIGRAALREMGF